MTSIYIAGPLFNSHERAYLEQIDAALVKAGYKTFLPHRDAGLLDAPQLTFEQKRDMFRADIAAMDRSDIVTALLTGPDQDSGTASEVGYMYAKGKPCFGISDDLRWQNNMVWGMCGEGARIARSIPDLVEMLKVAYPPK